MPRKSAIISFAKINVASSLILAYDAVQVRDPADD
jgi:hypothetical protein